MPERRTSGAWALLSGALALAALAAPAARPLLVWNVSRSAPLGLYVVAAPRAIARGDMVIARLPARFARLAAARRYLPLGVPLVKRIAAVPGDRICTRGERLILPGQPPVARLRRDRAGRPMPLWRGCGQLARDRYLLVMADVPGSFDGRYFGPSDVGDILGEAQLTWPR
ncbi:S26 family signal peptidase [Sphingomonas crusticola]|uniref:S26 family signal peptidase n=1 Tax=Sphingomonas crusticola TaxID=1697973 RepID=UPI001F073481|nr:S26 family signal peptidase [Sphingomonas crusticola]